MPIFVAIFSNNGKIFRSRNHGARFRRKHSQLPAQHPGHQHGVKKKLRVFLQGLGFLRAAGAVVEPDTWILQPGTWGVPGMGIISIFVRQGLCGKLFQSGKSSPRAHLELLPPGRQREGEMQHFVLPGQHFPTAFFSHVEPAEASEKGRDVLGKKPGTSSQPELGAGFTRWPSWKPQVMS